MATQPRRQPPAPPDDTGPAGPPPPPGARAQRLRWAAALAVVLIAHALALFGLVRVPGPAVPEHPLHEPVEAILLPPPPPPPPPPAAPSVDRQPGPAAAPPSARPTRPSPDASPSPRPTQGDPAPADAVTSTPPPDAAPPTAASPGPATANGPGAASPAPSASGNGDPAYAAPPSVTLHYASFVNGVQNPDGRIHWQQEGGQYRLFVETRVLWFRFAFRSEGEIGPTGLLPQRYVEERRKRSAAVRFDRQAGKLVFETRGGEVPLPPAAQDRFSVFLQLVGMVRANPAGYAEPGVTETFQVADTDELEPMQVRYVGEEEVQTAAGAVRARHFVRLPRHADDRRRVEVWLAPEVGWMPVRLQQTEPDGTRIELVLRGTAQ
ncbi:DUF3108 domain-containing protein [Cupriavidus sp. AU9028]|uniref:DUF3108 domain-containing protein n=1 Tax=Cupriavidus sp. AU9028 TaxID=2871157 RepID=UPI002102A67D|nr:DUF3108 domain-containing protein [Cupriavidus sp. AU9028]